MEVDLLITNGQVVFPGRDVQRVNIGVKGERIAGFYDPQEQVPAKQVLDVSGLYVFPGAIDPHVHLGIYNDYLEDFEIDTRCAALGGYTTIVNYYRHKETYLGTIMEMAAKAEERSTIDFAFSLGLLRQKHWDEFEDTLKETGVTSWKFYRQYERKVDKTFGVEDPLLLDDAELLETMRRFWRLSERLLVCIHSENMDFANRCMAEVKRGPVSHTLEDHHRTSPGYAEADSVLQNLFLAKVAGSRNVYIVHLSAGESVEILRRCRWLLEETGTVVETTPHYLNLNINSPCGLYAKVGPPIHTEWDSEQLWEGIKEGLITAYGGDHIPVRPLEKKGGQDLWTTKLGFGGIGVAFSLMLSEGHHKRGLTLPHIASLLSEQPARSFGLYPKKGAMQVGADADFAIVDLELERQITADMPEVSEDYSVYDGMVTKGWPVMTVSRGEVIARDRQVVAKPGRGRYLRREW